MPEWFVEAVAGSDPLPSTTVLVTRAVLAFVFGFLVAGVYYTLLGRRRPDAYTLTATLVLLTILVALTAIGGIVGSQWLLGRNSTPTEHPNTIGGLGPVQNQDRVLGLDSVAITLLTRNYDHDPGKTRR